MILLIQRFDGFMEFFSGEGEGGELKLEVRTLLNIG